MGVLLFSIVPRTIGLFLLGACVWRWNLLRGDRRVLTAIAIVGMVLGTFATMIRANWASIVLAFGYGGAIALAARPLRVIAPLGRMAFTCYLAQSLILSFVFYGWGLGQFGHMSAANGVLLAFAIYAAQAMASALWLRRFRFGPLEWVWRSFSYGRRV
jgi:Predicted membrane protein